MLSGEPSLWTVRESTGYAFVVLNQSAATGTRDLFAGMAYGT